MAPEEIAKLATEQLKIPTNGVGSGRYTDGQVLIAAEMLGMPKPTLDPYGLRPILARLRGKKPRPMLFSVRGPYRWVRHPLYLFMILMIWSCPDLTPDRLLFNGLWTVWIFIGSILEERDLVYEFGDVYRDYQRKVPMLIPRRFHPIQ